MRYDMSFAQLGVLLYPCAEGRSTSADSIFTGSTLPNSPGQQRFYSLPVEQIREFQQIFIVSDLDFFTIIGNRDAAWIRNCRHELEQMHHLPNNWNGYGSIPPNANAIKNTQDVLDNLYEMNMAPVSVAPSAEDGVTISITKDNKHAIIECYNDGDIMAMTYEGENQPDIWQMGSSLSEIKDEINRIYDIING
ncbi:MAG: hypothetical protein WAK96_12355 [Desulfobaccales bacterium]